jgi:hypothetical protein
MQFSSRRKSCREALLVAKQNLSSSDRAKTLIATATSSRRAETFRDKSAPGVPLASRGDMQLRFFTLALACASVIGCTRGITPLDELPTGPTAIPVTVIELTVTPVGGGTISVGDEAPITTNGGIPSSGALLGAFARFSNGSSRYVEAAWTSSDDNIITVSGATLIGRGRGTATLTATFEGRSASEKFVAEGGIAGRWSGSYLVEQCTATSGSMTEVLCGGDGRPPGFAAVGRTLPFSMEIVENNRDLSGVVSFGQNRGTLTGRNRGAGFFYLLGSFPGNGGSVNVFHWDTRVVRDSMEGFIAYEIRLQELPGVGRVAAKLTNMTRRE